MTGGSWPMLSALGARVLRLIDARCERSPERIGELAGCAALAGIGSPPRSDSDMSGCDRLRDVASGAMSGYRFEIEAFAGPARRGRVGGGAVLLVRVRLFDGPGVVDGATGAPAREPDAFTDLDPREARDLASCLLAAADAAERHTVAANCWEPQR